MSILATIAKPEYNNVITANPAGSAYAYSASTGVLDANFAGTIGTTDSIQILTQGYQFAWKPDTVNVLDSTGVLTLLDNVNANATAQVWNNKITYVGTTAATSDEFVVEGNQLKHSVRMVAPPTLPSGFTGTPQFLAIGGDIGTTSQDWASIDLWADGTTHLTDFVTSDDLKFCLKSDGTEIYRIPHITVTDDAGNETAGQYKLVFGANNAVTMYMLCPWSWMQSATYPIIIDPTVVVNSAYQIDARPVRLSNNWLVICAYNSSNTTVYFYVSKDGGQTWSQLCYVGAANYNAIAIASVGTTIYAVMNNLGSSTIVNCYVFDATTVTNTNITQNSTFDGVASTIFGPGISLAIDSQGNLHCAWCSKNANYNVSNNIRYSKGTVSGTTVTWTSPTQLTVANTSGWGCINPNIFVDSSNVPYILANWYTGGNNAIIVLTQKFTTTVLTTATGWGNQYVYQNANFTQKQPVGVINGNATIYALWMDNGFNSVAYSKSTDGGNTWSAESGIPNNGTNNSPHNPTISSDNSNNLYAFWSEPDTSGHYQVYYSKYTASSASWSTPTAITSGMSTSQIQQPQALWSMFDMNSSDAVRMIYSDGGTNTVEYYTIALDTPPNAPTLNPVTNFDATKSTTFSWTFSDPDPGDSQSAFQLQIVDASNTSTPVVDTGKTASTNTSYTLAANTLSNSKRYQWRVQTWDSSGQQGPYSAYSTFNTAGAPTTTLTSPANSSSITTSSITAQWSYSDPGSYAQQSFQVQLLASDDTTVLNDSGTVTSSGNQYTISYTLQNNTTYHVRVRTTNSQNVTSAWSDNVFSTSFTLPQQPSVTASSLSTQAKITIAMTNYASTNLVENSGFEVVTTTATLFSDALTSYTGSTVPAPWTLQGGTFTFGTSGATCGSQTSQIMTGNSVWVPLLGSDGSTKLPLTIKATFVTPSTIISTGGSNWNGVLSLTKQLNPAYQYGVIFTGTQFQLFKQVNGQYSNLAVANYTPVASTTYEFQLSIDNTGALTGHLMNSSGTDLITPLTATDTSLTGGYQILVGGDTGVIISNASVTAPWANSWTIGGDSRVAWGLTQSAIGGKYSAVGYTPPGSQFGGYLTGTSSPSVSQGESFTVSGYVNGSNLSNGAYVYFNWGGVGGSVIVTSPTGTFSTTRLSQTGNAPAGATSAYPVLQLNNGGGTVTFDNIQLEQGTSATPYIENDSTSSSQAAPAIAYNDVYRRNSGTSAWTRIATNISASGTYDDYAVASGQGYDYKVTAVGNNGTQADSAIITASVSFNGLWVHDVTNPSGTIVHLTKFYFQSSDGSMPSTEQWTPTATEMQFAGRTLPVVDFGEQTNLQLTKGKVTMFTSDAKWVVVQSLIENRNVLCIRDARGRLIYGVVPGGYSNTDLLYGQQVDLAFTAVDYSPAV